MDPSRPFHYVHDLSKIQREELQKRFGKDYGYKYYVVRTLHRTLNNGQQVTVPLFFLTDGCSGPGLDYFGEAHWLAHDWMYAVHADDQGKAIEKDDADSILTSWHRNKAVKWLGHGAWVESGGKPKEHLYLPENMRPKLSRL